MNVSPGGGGTIEVNQSVLSSYPDTSSFGSGDSVHLSAVAAPGYRFENWSGDLSGNTNPATVVIDCNKKIIANFSRIMHTLTIQINGGGSATPLTGSHSYGEGIAVSITAIPDSGWQFDKWTGDTTTAGLASITMTIDSDKTVTANFTQAKSGWWFIGGITLGILITGAAIWLIVRSRTA